MKILGILLLFCAVGLWVWLRRWADLSRVRCIQPHRRRVSWPCAAWSRGWWVIHLVPSGLALAGLLLFIVHKYPPPPPLPPPPIQVPVFEFSGDPLDLDGMKGDLSKLGMQLIAKGTPSEPGLLPGVLDYPWDDSVQYPQGAWRQLSGLREVLARRFAQGTPDRIIPVRRVAGVKSFRYVPSGTTTPIRCTFYCDKAFMGQVSPILSYALDRSAVPFRYEMIGSSGRSLPSTGVVRFSSESERIQAETLAVLLSETLGLTDIHVAPVAEPLLQGITVNLGWKSNARYLSFVWDTIDRLLADDIGKDPETQKRFSPDAWQDVVEWLKTIQGQESAIGRDNDFRKDWVDRYRGPWAFTVDAGSKDGAARSGVPESQAGCWLSCNPVKDAWIVQRAFINEPVKSPAPPLEKTP